MASQGQACANCARRKTKCDRNKPCSSCISSKLSCQYVIKRIEKKARVPVSTRYETGFAEISAQLEDLSNSLNYLVDRVDALDLSSTSQSRLSSATTRISAEEPYSVSTLSSHPETIVEDIGTDVRDDAIDIVETLTAGSKVKDSLTQEDSFVQSTSSSFSQYPDLIACTLPPMAIVLKLLALVRTSKQKYFIEFPHMSEDVFTEICQKIYFPTQPFTIFAWLNVNCGLFYLFRDLDLKQLRISKKQKDDMVALCSRNVDSAVRCLRICVESSFEAAQALLCAAFVVMEGERGSLSWTLLCTAARMTIDLGFHRFPIHKAQSRQRTLFWHIYALDRSLAFNFGRSATIQDNDVKTELPTAEEDFQSEWGFTFLEFISFARLQYEAHEQVLCAKAQQMDESIRVQKIHDLAARLSRRQADLQHRRPDKDHTAIMVGIASMLTAVYRPLPINGINHPLIFHPLCIAAGRSALSSLVRVWQVAMKDYGEDTAEQSVKLPLLFIPYVPYIAVFANQIATSDQSDLYLMRDVVSLLRTVAETTVATKKMYSAFSRLLSIAEAWPRTTTSQSIGSKTPLFNDSTMTDLEWQSLGLPDNDWGQALNEFDFGLGSDAIRDMMPWFEQQLGEGDS